VPLTPSLAFKGLDDDDWSVSLLSCSAFFFSLVKDGYKCVMLDQSLKESNPELYQSIMQFAEENKLKICKESEDG